MALFSSKDKTIESAFLARAQAALAAAVQEAERIGVQQNVAVVDEGNNLVAFARMDGAWIGSIEIAQHKAWTARAFDVTTAELGKMASTSGPLHGIQNTNDGRVVIFGGGIPLKVDGKIVGAIGVSGGTVSQDTKVAEAGAEAFQIIR